MKRLSHTGFLIVRRLMLCVALVGLFASTYLLITYVTGAPIVCGTAAGCDIVRSSPQAKTVFELPRPLLGVLFYGAVIAFLVARIYVHKRSALWTKVGLALTGIGFIESAWLTLVQAYDIKAFCNWCVVSAVCTTVLFVLAFFEGEGEPELRQVTDELKWTFYAVLVAVIGGGFFVWTLLSKDVGGKLPSLRPADLSSRAMQVLVPEGAPSMGPVTATVTVVEFLDLECPACRLFHPVMQRIKADYAGRVRFVERQFPLVEVHPNARMAAIAASCAQRQGRYFEYSTAALLNQRALGRGDLVRYAEALKLDPATFQACLDDASVASQVDAERKEGDRLGINSTPSLFVNDEKMDGVPSYEQFKAILDERLK